MNSTSVSSNLHVLTMCLVAVLFPGCHEGDCYGVRGDACSTESECRNPYVCIDGICALDNEEDVDSGDANDVSRTAIDGGGNGKNRSACWSVCDLAAINCAGCCITYTNVATKNDCDVYCKQNKDSCYARCTTSDDNIVNELVQCQATCSNNGMTCNAFCLTKIDPASMEDCGKVCIQDMKLCVKQC